MLPNCTATTRLHGGASNPKTTSAAFFQSKTDLFKYYYYSLITLSHSLRLRPLFLQTPTTLSSFLSPHGGKFSLQRGKFFPHLCWKHWSISNLPPEGRKSRDRGSGGWTFILEEIFTSPGLNPTSILLTVISAGAVWTIIYEKLDITMVSSRWVLRILSPFQKDTRRQCFQENLELLTEDPEHFIQSLVTGDETWLYHRDPECKIVSMHWKHKTSPTPKF